MNTLSLLASGLTLATVGMFSGQSAMFTVGTGVISAAGTAVVVSAEQKKKMDKELQTMDKRLVSSQGETLKRIAVINEQVEEALAVTEKISKIDQKVQQIHTSNRLVVGKLQKCQHEQTAIKVTLERQQQEFQQRPMVMPAPVFTPPPPASNLLSLVPSLPQRTETTAHIVIDGNNFSKNIQELGLDINWKFLKTALVDLGKDSDQFCLKYYGGVYKKPTQAQREKLKHLQDLKYEVISLPLAQLPNGQWKTLGDDMAIGVDLMDATKAGDEVILVTGDGDFIPLIEKLLDRQVQVKVVGSAQHTNSRLRNWRTSGFEFVSLESLIDRIIHLKKLRVA